MIRITPHIPAAARLVAAIVLLAASSPALALDPPVDPAQSITYWKPHVVAADEDAAVARAHAVFGVLLRAWDRARLAPSLYVVDADASLWAASLADGSILLTRSALDTIAGFGPERGEHLLAFVLAHELAHQRSDDLWHQRFFRLIGDQDPELRRQLKQGLALDAGVLTDMAEKEAQADHDGLLMMASVGYDPYQILDERDFFTAWIEHLWKAPCNGKTEPMSASAAPASLAAACQEAQGRALRARAQLQAVAAQSTLYAMGVQAFVAARYPQARHYFTVYGRSYTNRAVLTAIGMTHFYEALASQRRLRRHGAAEGPDFYYPLLLDATPLAPAESAHSMARKRSAARPLIDSERRRMAASLAQAIQMFEKAIRLTPDHPKTYLMLAGAYLLDGNTFMAKGIVQGKFIPKFGPHPAADLLLAMMAAGEGAYPEAQKAFEALCTNWEAGRARQPADPFPRDLLVYSAYHNGAALAEHQGQDTHARELWQALAAKAKAAGNGILFRLALNHLAVPVPDTQPLTVAPKIAGLRIGDRFATPEEEGGKLLADELWIEGTPYRVWRAPDGARFVVGPQARVVSAWQEAGAALLAQGLAIGDDASRPMMTLGIPDRRLHLLAGEFWAYDDYGIAMHIENQKVAGWFLYASK